MKSSMLVSIPAMGVTGLNSEVLCMKWNWHPVPSIISQRSLMSVLARLSTAFAALETTFAMIAWVNDRMIRFVGKYFLILICLLAIAIESESVLTYFTQEWQRA